MHAALKNARIPLLHETFNEFKARTEEDVIKTCAGFVKSCNILSVRALNS